MSLSPISGSNFIDLLIVFIWTFFSSFGLPGAEVLRVYSGALADNIIELTVVIISGAVAAIMGDIIAYWLARRFSLPLSKRLINFKFFRNNEPKARELFKKHGFLFVFFTRFALTTLSAVVNYLSGFERLNWKKFLIAVISGEMLYAIIYPLLGFIYKQAWNDITNMVNDIIVVIILIVIIAFLSKFTFGKMKTKKSKPN